MIGSSLAVMGAIPSVYLPETLKSPNALADNGPGDP
jgi:hypothetical protein